MVTERRAGRVLLIAGDSVLLLKGFDPGNPDAGTWWLTPGGGVADAEPVEAAAVREVFEETGLRLAGEELGPVVATRVAEFEFEGTRYHQSEWFFAVKVPSFAPTRHGWEDVEHRSLLEFRWWTPEELEVTDERVYPRELLALLESVLAGATTEPLHLSGD